MGDLISYQTAEASSNPLENITLEYFESHSFNLVLKSDLDQQKKIQLISFMCRVNILYMISNAGSGHIGSSFSSIDLIAYLQLDVLNYSNSDILFSSKGHDIPAFYSLYTALDIIPFDKIHQFRKYDGLPGHPDQGIPGFYTNTGSLGMGISKAKGFLKAHDLLGNTHSKIFVILGDGELQEGQNWESLINIDYKGEDRLYLIVDNNKVQSDKLVSQTSDLRNIESKFKSFSCHVERINGHDYKQLSRVFNNKYNSKVVVIIADTIKGKGVSFMEHPNALKDTDFYKYHSGAPTHKDYVNSIKELELKITDLLESSELKNQLTTSKITRSINPGSNLVREKLIEAYSQAILNAGESVPEIIAFNADLILDNGLIEFSRRFPDRFIECGIAEQDMVSQAGTASLSGFIPIVHSFSSFLTTRSSEQIYNNACQMSKIIYVGTLSGILPGGPGSSHQSVRDISMMKGLNLNILEPSSASQMNQVLDFCIQSPKSSYIRITSIPVSKTNLILPKVGTGNVVNKNPNSNTTIICFGALMLEIAQEALSLMKSKNQTLTNIIESPWIAPMDFKWYLEELKGQTKIIIAENHLKNGGIYESFLSDFSKSLDAEIISFSIPNLPLAYGENNKVMEHHNITAEALLDLIQ